VTVGRRREAGGVDAARLGRLRLLSSLNRISSLPSVQCCGRTVLMHQGFVGVEVPVVAGEGRAGFTGLQTCGSVSSCPVCSPNEREQRAATIEAAALAHLRSGGELVFMTLTLPHDKGDSLRALLTTLTDGWKSLQDSAEWRALCDVIGIEFASSPNRQLRRRIGFVRAVEVTEGMNGWHPHLHLLLFVKAMNGRRFRVLQRIVRDQWQTAVIRDGWRLPEQFDFQRVIGVKNAEGLARYLSKLDDQYVPGTPQWGVHREMTRGDRKKGRRWHTRSPFQIAESAAGGHGGDLVLWHEYEQATKGKKIITPSQGLFAHLGAADLAAQLAVDTRGETYTAAEIDPADWRIVIRFKARGDVLAAAALGGGQAVDDLLSRLRGWDRALSLARDRDLSATTGLSPVTVLAQYRSARGKAA
jgi:hypothetical protein